MILLPVLWHFGLVYAWVGGRWRVVFIWKYQTHRWN